MSTKQKLAREAFSNGYNCCQAVISAFSESYGIEKETALKFATAFGGGMTGNGQTCGVVTGALMAIGLKHGRVVASDDNAREKNKNCTNAFIEEFVAEYGHLGCNEILGYDMGTPEGKAKVKELGLREKICVKAVERAAEILEGLIGYHEN